MSATIFAFSGNAAPSGATLNLTSEELSNCVLFLHMFPPSEPGTPFGANYNPLMKQQLSTLGIGDLWSIAQHFSSALDICPELLHELASFGWTRLDSSLTDKDRKAHQKLRKLALEEHLDWCSTLAKRRARRRQKGVKGPLDAA